MNTESGIISNVIDCPSADNCINPWCGKEIPSQRQIDIPGVETCGNCPKVDLHEEER